MDYIKISNLEVFSRHGVFEEENRLGQKFALNAKLYFDTRDACTTDDIEKSVDYSGLCHFMTAFMKGHTFNLIETAAGRLANDILIEYPRIERVVLEVRKPWAPIGLPIEEVSVTVDRGWHKAFLSLGSNMGDREKFINNALGYMDNNDEIRIIKESDIIETEPYGNKDQAMFLNCAVEIQTLMNPNELLTYCKNIEKISGRIKTEHWGPRPLDMDILLFDNEIIDTNILTIPHVDMQNRDFVLTPMMEIAPYVRHPGLNKTIKEMYDELKKEK